MPDLEQRATELSHQLFEETKDPRQVLEFCKHLTVFAITMFGRHHHHPLLVKHTRDTGAALRAWPHTPDENATLGLCDEHVESYIDADAQTRV